MADSTRKSKEAAAPPQAPQAGAYDPAALLCKFTWPIADSVSIRHLTRLSHFFNLEIHPVSRTTELQDFLAS